MWINIKDVAMKLYNLKMFFVVLTSLLPFSGSVFADSQGQVARLSFVQGKVSLLPAGTKKWVKAVLNRPYVIGDRVWTALDTRAELQLATGVVRIGALSSVKILNLDQKISQFQLAKGTLAVSIWSLNLKQTYEIDTPNLALVVKFAGAYRIDVDTKTNSTRVTIASGTGTVYGEKSSYRIQKGFSCTFTGTNLQNYHCIKLPKPDAFGMWLIERDTLLDRASTTKYVSRQTIGYQDLDNHGQWRATKQYGRVWVPNVTSNWAPYRVGQWIWLDSWGWTWVDEQPWGFAPFHYGRWVHVQRSWAWIPGPREITPIYAPALVVFVGGRNRINLARGGRGIAWFPLGPGEIYIPPYRANRDYFLNVNRSNTIISDTYITNVFNNQNINIVYQNLQVPNAVTAVPTNVFVSSAPISGQVVPVPAQVLTTAPKSQLAAVVPEPASVTGGANAVAEETPPADAINAPAVVKTDPPPPPPPFEETQKILEKDPGVPLTDSESEKLSSATKGEGITVVKPQVDAVEAPEIKITPEENAGEAVTTPETPDKPGAEPQGEEIKKPVESIPEATEPEPAAKSEQPAAEPTPSPEPGISAGEKETQPAETPTPADEPILPPEEISPPAEAPAEEPVKPAEEVQPSETTQPDDIQQAAEPTEPEESMPSPEPEQPALEPSEPIEPEQNIEETQASPDAAQSIETPQLQEPSQPSENPSSANIPEQPASPPSPEPAAPELTPQAPPVEPPALPEPTADQPVGPSSVPSEVTADQPSGPAPVIQQAPPPTSPPPEQLGIPEAPPVTVSPQPSAGPQTAPIQPNPPSIGEQAPGSGGVEEKDGQ
jgi:hypothetical protein